MSEFPETDSLEGTATRQYEFPVSSLREFLLPSQTVFIKTFEDATLAGLDAKISAWVHETQNIIAIPSSVSKFEGVYMIALSYVSAN